MRTRTSITILLIVTTVFLVVIARCFYLQHFRCESYEKSSSRAQRSVFVERPRRGAILDCRGRVLAASLQMDTVFAEPRAIKELKKASAELAKILAMSPLEISRKILTSRNSGYVKILEKVSLTDSQRKKIRSIRGIGIEKTWQRYYPSGRASAHVVGFVGADNKGLAGLELKYDSLLAGNQGKSTFFADAARRPIGIEQFASLAADGSDIVSTIDATIQDFVYSALSRQLAAYEAESAFATVMDPCSGAVLAMVSIPDFDPMDLANADPNCLGNHILSDPFEPGSIFKPIITAWAIDTENISPDEVFFCENGNYAGKGFGRIGEYRKGYGNLTVKEILAFSSNIGMAKIGQKMGEKNIYEGVRIFGFGSKTGIDLPGEENGLVWGLKRWNGYSVARVPFGHEILVTGLQIASAYCVLANDGRVVKPHLARAVVENQDQKVRIISPPLSAGCIIKPETAKWIVRQGLSEVVNAGTGKKAALKNYQVWGKTGTANIAKSHEKGYDETNYVASFAGGVPAENPALVIVVSIRKPNRKLGKGYTGGSVAAPVVKEILEKTLNYL